VSKKTGQRKGCKNSKGATYIGKLSSFFENLKNDTLTLSSERDTNGQFTPALPGGIAQGAEEANCTKQERCSDAVLINNCCPKRLDAEIEIRGLWVN
jgi:hypothetical protein